MSIEAAEAAVKAHVAKEHAATYREPSGMLTHPYLVPAGPYTQVWDWDSAHMGVGLKAFGGLKYLRGSMMNFLEHVRSARVCGLIERPSFNGPPAHAADQFIKW